MNFQALTLNDADAWKNILSKVELYDMYHTPAYHSTDNSGEPRLLVFEENNKVMALPLIIRNIPETNLKDATSVYGYAGWIRSSNTYFPEVNEVMKDYFIKENIISAFSRLHPLIPDSDQFSIGNVVTVQNTTAIDLTLTPEQQFNFYSESVRRSIKKSEKRNLNVRMAKTMDDLNTFIHIYKASMSRLKANLFYYFSEEYFEKIWKNSDFNCYIFIADMENQAVGAGMFTECNNIMQYHLGGVDPEYIHLSPLKNIIDKARLHANERGLNILHLGGGHGGHDDSLYTFKSRMTTLRFHFKVWKWIVNQKYYDELSYNKGDSDYFPLYRKEN